MDVEELAQGRTRAVDGLVRVDLDSADRCPPDLVTAAAEAARAHPGLLIGVAGSLASPSARVVAEALTTTLVTRAGGEMAVLVDDSDAAFEDLRRAVVLAPIPARVLGEVLRATATTDVRTGIIVESLAYSTLLGGQDFRRWRASRPVRDRTASRDAVRVEREGDVLRIELDRPDRRNALDAAARGALSDALEIGMADPSLRVVLSGRGPVFCSGGDLDEFGTATDLALAHALRMSHGPAIRMAQVADRTTVRVHGTCVGAGVELAAFASCVVGAPGTTFVLPELSMGLIPGAGGTVSVPRRIGRWRAAWWMLAGARLDLDTALDWGLVDRVS